LLSLSSHLLSLVLHCFTTRLEGLSEDRLLGLHELFPLIESLFEPFSRLTGEIVQTLFRSAGIATQLFT
jgi:hypothetical protein